MDLERTCSPQAHQLPHPTPPPPVPTPIWGPLPLGSRAFSPPGRRRVAPSHLQPWRNPQAGKGRPPLDTSALDAQPSAARRS